jgi:hypothetical protein
MKLFFKRNIDNKCRLLRALAALSLLVGAGFAFSFSVWVSLVLLAAGVFVAFEALRAWCVLRACGIRTKI